jgi:TonB family protein
MRRHAGCHFALCPILVALLLVPPGSAWCQSADLALTRAEEAEVDLLASHAAQKIREAKLEEKEPTVLVIDFFRNSPGNSSRLGTLLADRFSESLAAYSSGLKILDRKILKDYQMGATGVILGTLYEENGQISLTIHLDGFGRPAKETDPFQVTDERARFPVTEQMHAMLFQPGPNYSRTADAIPEEPGIFRPGSAGVTSPNCIHCPSPSYSDAARAAKFQGTVTLSIVVTAEGNVTSIYVLKGAPFGLTAKAIEATMQWRLKPAEKDGKPVSVRVPVESTFRLF